MPKAAKKRTLRKDTPVKKHVVKHADHVEAPAPMVEAPVVEAPAVQAEPAQANVGN